MAVSLVVLAMLLTRGAPNASADSCTLVLNVANTDIAGFPAPYVCVSIAPVDPTRATITFTSDTTSGYTYVMGGESSVALNVNATSFTVLPGISGSNSLGNFFTPGPYSNGGSETADGFGKFDLTVKSFDGFGHSATSITFTLTDLNDTWASASNVLTPNTKGYDAASHIYVESPRCTTTTTGKHGVTTTTLDACATGYAADGDPVPVPEPAMLALLGTGLMMIGGRIRRRLRKK